METSDTTRPRGWFSWLCEYLWESSRPRSAAGAPPDFPERGVFFPFLREEPLFSTSCADSQPAPSGNSSSSGTTTSAPRKVPRRPSTESCNERIDVEQSRVRITRSKSGRGKAWNLEPEHNQERLRGELPLIWAFFSKTLGWTFVGNSWDVRGPKGGENRGCAASGGGCRVQCEQAGPMPQTQLVRYLVEHPDLMEDYLRWRREGEQECCGKGSNGGRDAAGSRACSPRSDSENRSRSRSERKRSGSAASKADQPRRQQTLSPRQSPFPPEGVDRPRKRDERPEAPVSSAPGCTNALTPPPALRTRSRSVALRQQCVSEPPRRRGRGERERQGARDNASFDTGTSRTATSSSSRSGSFSARSSEVGGEQQERADARSRGDGALGVHRRPHDGASTDRGNNIGVPEPSSRRLQKRPAPSGKRRKTLVIGVESGDGGDGGRSVAGGVAGRLGSGRRAGTTAKRRFSDIQLARSHSTAGASATAGNPFAQQTPAKKTARTTTIAAKTSERHSCASGDEEQPVSKRPRIKKEGERMTPFRSRRKGGSARGGGGGGGGGGSSSDAFSADDGDPLAVYSRIEAETTSDEGLEEMLRTSRRDGYLDLRRYRKPGWPRPLRITRLEASHGKRFEEHLLGLLEEGRRVEANVLLRRLAHFDRNPPHLAAAAAPTGIGGRASVACIPAWYQQLAMGPKSCRDGGGAGVEELVDLTEKEVDVVECFDNEPVDCVMMRVVKQEPGLGEKEEEGEEEATAAASATCDSVQGSEPLGRRGLEVVAKEGGGVCAGEGGGSGGGGGRKSPGVSHTDIFHQGASPISGTTSTTKIKMEIG